MPNDLLYIFPVVILGTFAILIGLGVLEPYAVGEPADPFATPLEILPGGIFSQLLTFYVFYQINY